MVGLCYLFLRINTAESNLISIGVLISSSCSSSKFSVSDTVRILISIGIEVAFGANRNMHGGYRSLFIKLDECEKKISNRFLSKKKAFTRVRAN